MRKKDLFCGIDLHSNNSYVAIMLACADLEAADAAAEELATRVAGTPSPLLRATAAHARGAVALAHGEPLAAAAALRTAAAEWQDLDAPYELAQTRVALSRGTRATSS